MILPTNRLESLRKQKTVLIMAFVSSITACVEDRQPRVGDPLCVEETCSPVSNDGPVLPFDMRLPDSQPDALADMSIDASTVDLSADLPTDTPQVVDAPGEAIAVVDANIDTAFDIPIIVDQAPEMDAAPADLKVDTIQPDMPPPDATPYVYQFAKTSSWLSKLVTPGADVVGTEVSDGYLYLLEYSTTIPAFETLHKYDLATQLPAAGWPKVVPTNGQGGIHAFAIDPATKEFLFSARAAVGPATLFRSDPQLGTYIQQPLAYGYPLKQSDDHVALENDQNYIYVANSHTDLVIRYHKANKTADSWPIPFGVALDSQSIYTAIANGRLYMYLEEAAGIVSTQLDGGAPSTTLISLKSTDVRHLAVKGDYAWIATYNSVLAVDLVGGSALKGSSFFYVDPGVQSPHGLFWVDDTLLVVDRCGRAHGFEDCTAVPTCNPLDGGLGGVDCDGAI